MFVWISTQLTLGRALLIIERTIIEMLACLDTDMSQELDVLVRNEARNMLNHQADIARQSTDRDEDIFRATAKEKIKERQSEAKKLEAKAKRASLPLSKPNNECCWYFTNGLTCPAKLIDAATGKC